MGRRTAQTYRVARGGLALVMLVQIILVCTPLTERLGGWLDVTRPASPSDVIICLGGRDLRLIWAAELFHLGLAPQVVVSNKLGAAQKMRDTVVLCGVPADRVLVDDKSCTTGDHPARIAELPGIDPAHQRFLIVTDRQHSRRAAACFRHAGYQHFTVYAGTSASGEGTVEPSHRWRGRVFLLPQLVYEYAALLKYRLQGRI